MDTVTPRASLRWTSGLALLLIGAGLYSSLLDDLPSVTHDAGDRPENEVRMWGTHAIGQTVRPPTTGVSGVELYLQPEHGRKLSGAVTLRVSGTRGGDELRSASVEAQELRRGAFTRFVFPALETRGDESFFLSIEYPTGTAERPLVVRVERPRPDGQPWNDYPDGSAYLDDQQVEGDLAFRLLSLDRKPFGVQAAVAAALGGFALIAGAVARRRPDFATAAVLGIGLPVVFGLPLLRNPQYLGARDWDMNMTSHTAAVRALVTEHAFPGWNPYLCGGTVQAAFPESSTFSPFFSASILAGPVLGFKINALLHLIIGYLGMLVWLRRGWRCSWLGAFLGAAVVMFSSFASLHLAEGHTRKVAFAWIPWALYFFQRATEERSVAVLPWWNRVRSAACSGTAFALMLLDGSVYLSTYTAFFIMLVGLVLSVLQRRPTPLALGVFALLLGGLIAGAHLVPVLASQAVLDTPLDRAQSLPPLRGLIDVFLDPSQSPSAQKFEEQSLAWSEYGAYVGIAPLILAAVGFLTAPRRLAPWTTAGVVFLLGSFSPTMQRLLDVVPVLGVLRNQQRMVGMVTIVVGLTAAVGFDRLLRSLAPPPTAAEQAGGTSRAARAALGVLSAIVIGHLVFTSTDTLASTFVIPPPKPEDAPFQQGWARQFSTGDDPDSTPFTMENTVRNRGSVNRCSVAGVRPKDGLRLPPGTQAPREFTDEPYLGEAFVLEGSGMARADSIRTSEATVRYEAKDPVTIALNQNYHPGWRAEVRKDNGNRAAASAFSAGEGIIGIRVPPGSGTVVFSYHPPFLWLGLVTTGVGLALVCWILRPAEVPRRATTRHP